MIKICVQCSDGIEGIAIVVVEGDVICTESV